MLYLFILELSHSASVVVDVSGPETNSPVLLDTHRKSRKDLENDMQAKEKSIPTPASAQTKTLSPCTLNSHRPYGSFPGDLNMLGVALNDSSIHGSLRDISNRTSCSAKNSQDHQLNSALIGDIEMESETSYFSNPNDLEWLNLTTFQNMHSMVDKQTEKHYHESNDAGPTEYREPLQMDVLSANLFENNKSQDPMSIFDIDGTSSLMVVDSHDSDKWDF